MAKKQETKKKKNNKKRSSSFSKDVKDDESPVSLNQHVTPRTVVYRNVSGEERNQPFNHPPQCQ